MGLGKPELYGFGFGESKTRPHPAPLPCLVKGRFIEYSIYKILYTFYSSKLYLLTREKIGDTKNGKYVAQKSGLTDARGRKSISVVWESKPHTIADKCLVSSWGQVFQYT
jgi:hypothetical protein